MTPLPIAAFALAVAALPAQAMSPQAEELVGLDRKLAPADCRKERDSLEAYIAGYAGNGARVSEIERRVKTVSAEESALRKRRADLLHAGALSDVDLRAVAAAREKVRELCPWMNAKDGSVPRDLPPARSLDDARFYVNVLVPLVLVQWRMCEVSEPQRKGELERGWAASRLSKLEAPEMQATVADVRGWMKEGYDTTHPDSLLAKRKESPNPVANDLCGSAADLKRIEGALPAGFLK